MGGVRIRVILLKDHHDNILTEALTPFHILTGEQVTNVLYAPGSVKRVKGYLKDLTDAQYIQAFPVHLGGGPPLYAYALAENGKKWLKSEHGIHIPFIYRPEMATLHTLELNKFLIVAKNLERVAPLQYHRNPITNAIETLPSVAVADIRHDFLLKKMPIKTTARSGRSISLVPDAILDVYIRSPNADKQKRQVLLIELERDTHRSKPFARKLQDYLTLIKQGALQAYLHTYNFRICYVSTIGLEHVEKMRRIAREVLIQTLGYINPASTMNRTFFFTAIPPLRGNPIAIRTSFLQPNWYVPFGEEKAQYILID